VKQFSDQLAAAAAGDAVAFRELHAMVAPPLARYLRARGCEDIEGVASEVFLRVFRSLRSFAGSEEQFRAWVFTIARNLMRDEHRRRSRRVTTEELDEASAASVQGGDVEDEALDQGSEKWVQSVLAELPDVHREVLVLRIVGDLTIDEVATVIGKSRGATKAIQRRALAAVRRIISNSGVPL